MGGPASRWAPARIGSMFTDAYMPPCWQNICHQQGGSTINWDFIDLHTLMFVRVRRGGSRGFMLHEDSLDDQFLRESLQQEREWIDKFRNKRPGALSRLDTSNSSKFSFSTEYSSGMPIYNKSRTAEECTCHSHTILFSTRLLKF